MSHFHIEEVNSLSEGDLRLMSVAWENFENKHSSQTSESLILVKSLVKVAFVQGYSSAKAERQDIKSLPYAKED